jgi:hypothetical protein
VDQRCADRQARRCFYLDSITSRWPREHVIEHGLAACAPWNGLCWLALQRA